MAFYRRESGDLNGSPFTCGSSCTLALPKGAGTANYTASKSKETQSTGPSLYRQIAKAYAAAQEERKRKEQERALEREEDRIEDAYRRSHVVPASSNLRAYDDIEDLRAKRVVQENTQTSTPSKPWWQSAWDNAANFVQQKIVQPVQKAWNTLKSLLPTRDQWEQMGLRTIVSASPLALAVPVVLPVLVVGGLALANIHYGPKPLDAFFGNGPDNRGVRIVQDNAEAIKNAGAQNNVPPIAIASGIAVQSQWGEYPWDDAEQKIANTVNPVTTALFNKEYINPSYGIARIGEDEMRELGVSGDPNAPSVSAEAMAKRIELAVNACNTCNTTDKTILAGMAQNGVGFTAANVKDIVNPKYGYLYPNGTINWNKYFDAQRPKSPKALLDRFRIPLLNWRAGDGRNYDTQFQLQVFTNDLQALANTTAWDLPQGIDEAELKYMQCLANRHQGDAPCQP